MGGTSRTDTGGAANALLLHPACHERVERQRSIAYELGWLVGQQNDPCDVPVRLWDGWFLLSSSGQMTQIERPADVALGNALEGGEIVLTPVALRPVVDVSAGDAGNTL